MYGNIPAIIDGFGTTRGVEFSVGIQTFFKGCPKLIKKKTLADAPGAKRQFMNPKAIDLCNIWLDFYNRLHEEAPSNVAGGESNVF